MFVERIISRDRMKILHPYDGFESPVKYKDSPVNLEDSSSTDLSLVGALTLLLQKVDNPEVYLRYAAFDVDVIIDDIVTLTDKDRNDLIFIKLNEESFKEIESPDSYESLTDIQMFLSDKNICDAKIFVSETERTSIIITNKMNITVWHMMGAFLKRLLPWIFKDLPPDEKEKEFLKSFTLRDPSTFIRLAEELMNERFDFRDAIIHEAFDGYMKRYAEQRIASSRSQIENLYTQIENALVNIRAYRANIENLNRSIIGFDSMCDEDEAELVDFIINCKALEVVGRRDQTITIDIVTPLVNYNQDDAESIVSNTDSYLYNNIGDFSREEANKLLSAIFIDQKFMVNMYARYDVDFVNCGVWGVASFSIDEGHKDCIPNMHLYRHRCLGNNGEQIVAALNANNYIGAINAMIASCANININEAVSNDTFFEKLFNTDRKVLLTEDGEKITTHEALRRIG